MIEPALTPTLKEISPKWVRPSCAAADAALAPRLRVARRPVTTSLGVAK